MSRAARCVLNVACWLLLLTVAFPAGAELADQPARELQELPWYPRIDFTVPALGPDGAGQLVHTDYPDGLASEPQCLAVLEQMEESLPGLMNKLAVMKGLPTGTAYLTASACEQNEPLLLSAAIHERDRALGRKGI